VKQHVKHRDVTFTVSATLDLKLPKAQALAIRHLKAAEEALINGSWDAVRDNAIRLAALAADRAAKEKS
jgi:hypothetical protein